MNSPSFDELTALVRERMAGREPAHDFLHVLRVVATARVLADAEGARRDVVEMAALLHELFAHPKGHPESHLSGDVCAEHAARLLREHGRDETFVEAVGACIRDHAFSKGVVPETLEARV
ncbi:MAG TPA: HD domain-containing protein, partial [Polyangiaceae bacterium]